MPNFLTEFANFADGTEAPENYHIWTAVGTMSAVLQGRVWLNYGRFKIMPNTYIVQLGPPGNGKTTSMSFGKKILKEIPSITMSAQAQTKESLVKELFAGQRNAGYGTVQVNYAPMAIFITELSHFLGPNSAHMIDFLTTVYDQDYYDNKTKNKGNELIHGPYISILACTTPEWVSTYLKSDIITGGFSRRAIFVNESESKVRKPWPDITAEQMASFNECVSIANSRKELIGEMRWTNEARIWFTDWYLKRVLPNDPTTRGFARTRHIQMLKVAIIVSACESENMVVTAEHLQIANEMLLRLEPNLASVFTAVGRNELHAVGNKIMELVKMNGGMLPEKQMLSAMGAHANTRELHEIKNQLVNTDQLRIIKATTNGVDRVILATPEVAARILSEQAKKQNPAVLAVDLQSTKLPDDSSSDSSTVAGQSSPPVA